MASPAQLVETVSSVTGVPLATIVDIDRKLVKGNLRTKGGRGFNAAQMTPLDAARLLAAVLGSPQANQSVGAVERYAETRVDKPRSSEKLFAATELADLAALPARHSFIDGLEALIASAATGSLAKRIEQSKDRWNPKIEVFAFTRATRGRIRISGLPNDMTTSVEYVPTQTHMKAGRIRNDIGDLEQSRRITETTVLSVAKLLAQEAIP